MSDIKGKISKVESGNSYTAVNKASNASGRYQFVRSTWEGLGYDWKDRFNPQLQEEAMTKLTNINKNEFRKRFGTDPSDADSYGLHFLGVAGYSKVKKADPNTPMSQLITGKAYDYNKNVFEKNGKPITVAQFNDWLTKKMNVKPSETTQQYSNQETQPYIPLDLNLPEMTGMTFAEEEKETEEKSQVNKREENANKLSFISDVKELQKQQQEQAYQPPQFLEQQLVEGVAYQPIQQNFQEGGIKVDPQGYWNPENLNRPVIIPSPNITMKNVDFSVLGTSLETGEQKLMQPNKNYFFKNTQNVLEQPYNKFQEGGTWVEIDRGNGKIEKINTDSDEYRQLYEENRVLGREGDTLVSPKELEAVTITGFRKTKPESLEQKINISDFDLNKIREEGIIEGFSKSNSMNFKKPNVAEEQKLTEDFNKKVKEEQKVLELEKSKKREDLDLPEDKPIQPINPKNEKGVLEAQKFLSSKGYNLNPEGKFKNQGIDGKLGKVTQSAISEYNKSLNNPTYTTYKKGEGFLGYCTEEQCSEFVQNENFRNLKPNIPRQKFNELTGLSGDAWTIGKNIEKAGGQKVPTNKVKEGDVITLFTGGSSPYLNQAKKSGTDATHTAIVDQVNLDGSYYVLHNVHEIDKVQTALKGSPQWRGREYRNLVKNGQIVGDSNAGFVVRDAYRPNYKEVKDFEKKVKVRDDVGLTIKQDKLKNLEKSNKSYIGVDINTNVNTYITSLNNIDTKKTIAVKHGLSESDYQSISKIALGILGQETGFGTSDKADVKRIGAEVREFFGGTEASRGDAQIKYETNYGKGDLNELGINKDNFTDKDKISLVVADIIATHYKYFIKKGEAREKALYKAVEKYNRGRSTKNSENYDSDYVNKVLNYADYFDVVDKKGSSYKTMQDELSTKENVVRKKIKNEF